MWPSVAVPDTHGGGEVGALYLGHGRGQHLVAVGALRVQAVALARARAPGAPRALLRRRLNVMRYTFNNTSQ